MSRRRILGVDIGGVIINHPAPGNPYEPILGSFDVIKHINQECFERFEKVVLISRADSGMEENIYCWLNTQGFWDCTGIPRSNLYFCEERNQKAGICQSLGVTDFVDDRSEVLEHMIDIVENLYLFQGREDEMAPRQRILHRLTMVDSWIMLARELIK